jgi:hypothetical protein
VGVIDRVLSGRLIQKEKEEEENHLILMEHCHSLEGASSRSVGLGRRAGEQTLHPTTDTGDLILWNERNGNRPPINLSS